jgi:hypothetical protein
MVGSLSVASTAASSAKVAVVDSGKIDRSAVYSRYNNGPRTLPWGTAALTGKSSCVFSFNFYDEVSVMQIES